jgi:hypothetical protein
MKPLCLAPLAALLACASTSVEHNAVPRAHTPEHFSFSTIQVVYPSNLTPDHDALVRRYQPCEQVAANVQRWAEETGMWGGQQRLRIEMRSVQLPARWQWDTHGPLVVGSGVGYRGEDHLDLGVQVLQQEDVLHHMQIARRFPIIDRTIQQTLSAQGAMDDLTLDVAWQIVFELTPPGYDEAIILAGHRDGVHPATTKAARRGLLSWGQGMKAAATGKMDLADAYCGEALSKPSWLPLWLWWIYDPTYIAGYKRCRERAEEDARRLGTPEDE